MSRLYLFLAILGLVFVLGAGLWVITREEPATLPTGAPPNVLLISVDTLRADRLGAYGGAVRTAFADTLAAGGVVFERAVSHVPITLPSHATIFTGRYPKANGVHDNGSYRLAEHEATLAEAFKEAGYRTAAFVGSFALDSRFGLDQGFELYDDFYGDTSAFNDFAISERPAEDVLAPALAWIQQAKPSRWFAFVHLYDPHAPYLAPLAFRESYPDDPYGAEVAHVDDALGRFVEALRGLGEMDNTLVILTSDHGESLGEHGEPTHGMFAYESTLHVPLLMSWRGVLPEGARVRTRVRLIDVAPTMLELAGLPPLAGQQGESLVPAILDPDDALDRDSYFEALAFHLNRNWAPLTGLYHGQLKYIDLPIPELYDLAVDPHESHNLVEAQAALKSELREKLQALAAMEVPPAAPGSRGDEVDEETALRLRALGYVVSPGTGRPKAEFTVDDDPKRLLPLSERFDRAVAAHMAGDNEEAIRLFRALIDERPSFTNAYANLSYVLHEAGRLQESIDVLRVAIERGARNRSTLGRLGAYLQEAGRLEESVVLLQSVVDEDPTYAEAFNYLGVSYARLGRTRDAVQTLSKVVALDPSYATAYANLGAVYLGGKQFEDAEPVLRKALELDPRLAVAWNGLGVVQASTGREDDAIESWKEAVDLDPRQYDTLYNLGVLLTKLNRFDEAIRYLGQFVETAPRDRYRDDIPGVRKLIRDLEP